MNRTTYTQVRRSIRDNGLSYTARMAAHNHDINALEICDRFCDLLQGTDWLAMRQQFVRHEKPVTAFKLTTPLLAV